MTPALVMVMAAGLLPSAARAAQRQSPPAALVPAIHGRVVADGTGDPIPNARVSVTPGGIGTPVVLADRDGEFTLAAPAAPFRVAASKSGYAPAEAPAPAPGTRIELRLHRGAVLSGRVVDEFGEAVPLFPVMVEAITNPPTGRPMATAQTNDRGEFRIAGLRPGTVAVAAVDVRSSVNVFTAKGAPSPPRERTIPMRRLLPTPSGLPFSSARSTTASTSSSLRNNRRFRRCSSFGCSLVSWCWLAARRRFEGGW